MTEEQALEFEIKARKFLIKKLAPAHKAIAKKAEDELAKRQAELETLSEYESYSEAQEAYGWGYITEEQFDRIAEFLEKGQEAVDTTRTSTDFAMDMLGEFINRLKAEIKNFEWEALPEAEKEKRRKANADWKAKIAEIKAKLQAAP